MDDFHKVAQALHNAVTCTGSDIRAYMTGLPLPENIEREIAAAAERIGVAEVIRQHCLPRPAPLPPVGPRNLAWWAAKDAANREWWAAKEAQMAPFRRTDQEKQRERRRRRQATRSPEQIALDREKERERRRRHRATLSPERAALVREKNAERQRVRRARKGYQNNGAT